MTGPFNANSGLALTVAAAALIFRLRHGGAAEALGGGIVGVVKLGCHFFGYFCACGIIATYIRWLLMRPPQRTPTKTEVALAIAAGKPLAPIDPRMLRSATQISKDLREGLYTSLEIVNLFIDHIERVDATAVNAVVFKRYEEARSEAKKADAILAEAREGLRDWSSIGWLTGVPCTMKETFRVRGGTNCCGHPRRHPDPAKVKQFAAAIAASGHPTAVVDPEGDEAVNVARLRADGAIIIVLTNTSEFAMWIESDNFVYGTTCNPYDATRIVGGSSGGEAAAVAAVYTPFGNGSDIGGSIRMPSMFCGTFGHKPSTRLVPNTGMFPGTKTYGNFIVGTGTMARHVEDLWPVMKTLSNGGFDEDPSIYPPCPLLDEQLEAQRAFQRELEAKSSTPMAPVVINSPSDIPPESLTVYLIDDLKLPFTIPCSAEQRRAAQTVVAELERNTGCTVHRVDFSDPKSVPPGWEKMRFALRMWTSVMRRDAVAFVDLMRGGYDGNNGEFRSVYFEWMRWLLGRSEHTFPAVTLCVIEDVEKRFIPEKDTDCDVEAGKILSRQIADTLGPRGVLICPAFPFAAAKHSAAKLLIPNFSYTCLFNALQTPTTSVPIWLDGNKENNNGASSSSSSAQTLPLGVQIISGWGNDVATMAAASALAKHTPFCYVKVPQWMNVVGEKGEK